MVNSLTPTFGDSVSGANLWGIGITRRVRSQSKANTYVSTIYNLVITDKLHSSAGDVFALIIGTKIPPL